MNKTNNSDTLSPCSDHSEKHQPYPKIIQAQDVAEILGVSINRVYNLARTNLIPSVKLGRQVRFNEREIIEWINKGGSELPGKWKHEN